MLASVEVWDRLHQVKLTG